MSENCWQKASYPQGIVTRNDLGKKCCVTAQFVHGLEQFHFPLTSSLTRL